MNQSCCLPFILICCSVTFMFLSKDGGTCVSAENPLKIKASWAAWENFFSMQMCIESRCQSGSPHNNSPMSQTEQKDAQTLSLCCFCLVLTRERVTFRDLWRCPLPSSPPLSTSTTTTTATHLTHLLHLLGKSDMESGERERRKGRGREKNQRRKTNQEP